MKNIPILITSVGGPPGRSAYESLKILNYKKIYTCDTNLRCSFNLLKKNKFFIVPKVNSKKYFNYIKKIIDKYKIKIIIPCIETEVIFWSLNKHKIKNVNFLIPPNTSLKVAINKFSISKIAKSLNIHYPKTQKIKLPVKKVNVKFKFPFIIKPTFSWGMKGFKLIKNKFDLNYVINTFNGEFIFQEYIKSNNQNIFAVGLLYNKNSKCIMSYCSKSLSTTNELGGAATSGVEINNKKLIIQSIDFINKIGKWNGPVMIEWIYLKKKNFFYLIDVNPRLWGYSILSTFNGKNFPANIINIINNKRVSMNFPRKKYYFVRDSINLKSKIN